MYNIVYLADLVEGGCPSQLLQQHLDEVSRVLILDEVHFARLWGSRQLHTLLRLVQ